MQHDDPIDEQAAAWAVRVGDPEFADWDGFTAWLERDPAHAAAYDRVAAAVADATEAVASHVAPLAANDDAPAPRLFLRRGAVAAVAAVLVIATSIGLWPGQGGMQTIATAPGETRLIALADGSSIELAGDSRIALDSDNPRFAALEQGRGLFTITHDESDPFVLDVGTDRLVDAGTVFDVQLRAAALVVAVAEGAVIFNPATQDVRIEPGQLLESARGTDRFVVRAIAREQVGEWRTGRLTFESVSIAQLAADLTSMSGIAFAAAPASAGVEVSGSLLIAPIRADPASLGPLLGLDVRRSGSGWVIEAR
jgi:transmembrane sensor